MRGLELTEVPIPALEPLCSGLELELSQAPRTSLDLAMPLGSEVKILVLLAGHAPGLSRSAGSVSAFPSSVQGRFWSELTAPF